MAKIVRLGDARSLTRSEVPKLAEQVFVNNNYVAADDELCSKAWVMTS
jgi:hypothetical protein